MKVNSVNSAIANAKAAAITAAAPSSASASANADAFERTSKAVGQPGSPKSSIEDFSNVTLADPGAPVIGALTGLGTTFFVPLGVFLTTI